jgi:hypothetical protein
MSPSTRLSPVLAFALLGGCYGNVELEACTYSETYCDGSSGSTASSSSSESSSESSSSSSGGSSGTADGGLDETSGTDTSSESSSPGGPTPDPEPVCGDGIVEGIEECDDDGPGCSDCTVDLRVFVTSEVYKAGELMSPYQADALCLHRAMDAGLADPERFKAWLSSSQEDARDRFNRTRGRLVMVNGLVFAADWSSLLESGPQNPLEVTELSTTHAGKVWTGTSPDGAAIPASTHCDDWSTISPTKTAYYGYSDEIGPDWTLADQIDNPAPCPITFALYCIESL